MARRTLPALFLVAAVAAAAGVTRSGSSERPVWDAPPRAPLAPLLGLVGDGQAQELVRIHPDTLRPRAGRRVHAGTGGCAPSSGGQACWRLPPWSFAPHRPLLALARYANAAPRSLRVVDVRRMRVVADVPLAGGAVGQLAWLAPERLVMVQEVCCRELQQLVTVELDRRRIATRRSLGGTRRAVAAPMAAARGGIRPLDRLARRSGTSHSSRRLDAAPAAMTSAHRRKAVRATCYALGAVATTAGLHTVLTGGRSLPGEGAAKASVESELRFYAAFYVAYGAAALRIAPRADRDAAGVRALAATLFLAGLARAGGWLAAGRPHPVQRGLLALELGLPPLLVGAAGYDP